MVFCAQASHVGPGPKVKIVRIIDGGTIGGHGHEHKHEHVHEHPPEVIKVVKVSGGPAPPASHGPAWPTMGSPAPVDMLKVFQGGSFNDGAHDSSSPDIHVIKIVKQTEVGGSGWHNANANGGWHWAPCRSQSPFPRFAMDAHYSWLASKKTEEIWCTVSTYTQ